jgi:hypothetical protein
MFVVRPLVWREQQKMLDLGKEADRHCRRACHSRLFGEAGWTCPWSNRILPNRRLLSTTGGVCARQLPTVPRPTKKHQNCKPAVSPRSVESFRTWLEKLRRSGAVNTGKMANRLNVSVPPPKQEFE